MAPLTVGGNNVVPMPNAKANRLYDSFRNFLAGLGVVGRDKAANQQFILEILSQAELEKAYRGDWLARKIIDIPAFDACRAWRAWQAEQPQIEKLEETERHFGLQRKIMDAMVKARLYGGAAIVLGVKNQDFKKELDLDKVGEGDLAFVHVVSRWMIAPGPLVRDITSPWFGQPEYYQRSNTPISPSVDGVESLESGAFGKEAGSMLSIHPSRVIRILGNPYPNMEIAPDAWGDSVLQTVVDAIKDAGLVGQSIAALTSKANVDVISIPGLTQMLSTDKGTAALVERFANANVAKSVVNSILIDKNEDWKQLQVTFSGLPQIFQMYLAVACGAADIPATRLLGKSPDGENATGDSDLRNYYDKLQADQKVRMTPAISPLDEVMIRHTFGDRPKEIHYEWNPLWQMDDVQKSEIGLKKAQAYKIDVDAAQISPDALRKGRENQLVEDGTYPGLEVALQDAEKESNEEVPENAIPPHPAIREKNAANEVAAERFKQTQQQQLKVAAAKPSPFGAPGGNKPPFGKPNGKSNGAAHPASTKDALTDDMPGGGQSSLGFLTAGHGLRRRKRRSAFEVEPLPPRPVKILEAPVHDGDERRLRQARAPGDVNFSNDFNGVFSRRDPGQPGESSQDANFVSDISDRSSEPEPGETRLSPGQLRLLQAVRARDASGNTGSSPAAGVLFVTADGRGLFVRRQGGDHAGEWAIPAGHVEDGEDAEQAAWREAAEETGQAAPALRQIDQRDDFTTFAQSVPETFDPALNAEHDEFLWAPIDDAPEPMHPGLKATLESCGRDLVVDWHPDQPRVPAGSPEGGQWGGGGSGGKGNGILNEAPPEGTGVRAKWKAPPKPPVGPSLLSKDELHKQAASIRNRMDSINRREAATVHGMDAGEYHAALSLMSRVVSDDLDAHGDPNSAKRSGDAFDYAYDKNGELTGACGYHVRDGEGYVNWLGSTVKGGGTTLLGRVVQHMIDEGASRVELTPRSTAIPFYESFGFKYEHGHMVKDLSDKGVLTMPPPEHDAHNQVGVLAAPQLETMLGTAASLTPAAAPTPAATSTPTPTPAAAATRRPSGAYAGMYATGGSPRENHDATITRVLQGPVQRGIHYRRMVARLIRDSHRFETPKEQQTLLRNRFNAALTAEYKSFARRGRTADASQVRRTMTRMGFSTATLPRVGADWSGAAARQPSTQARTPFQNRTPPAPAYQQRVPAAPIDPTNMNVEQLARALVKSGGHGTKADEAVVGEQLQKLPRPVLAKMARDGVRVVACRESITDYRQELKGAHPSGWPPWSTYEQVRGIYKPTTREAVVATVAEGHGENRRMFPPNVALHEALHGYDQANVGSGDFSGRADFRSARLADIKLLGDYYKQPNGRGEQETFAEYGSRHYMGELPSLGMVHLEAWFAQHDKDIAEAGHPTP